MTTGKVKWYNPSKGYGFITEVEGRDKDVFVHVTSVKAAGMDSLTEGQSLEFDIVEDRGKEKADNLKVAAPAEVNGNK